MISYRYHLVTVVGIFLAIALGVVIGTSALNGAVVGDLHRQVADLKQSNASATQRANALQAQSGNADTLAKTFGAQLAVGRLTKVPVVLIGAPGATSELKDAVAKEITAAGGTVAGRIQLSSALIDPQRATDVRSFATSGTHPIGLTLPSNNDAGALAGALLGFVLLGHGQATDVTSVLTGFETLNMLKTENGDVSSGRIIVMVAPGSRPAGDPSAKELASLTAQLASTGGPTVVVGDGASDTGGGLVASVRGDDASAQAVSTVDDIDTPLGQLTSVLVAQQSLAHHNGHYGTGTRVDGLLPGATG